MQRWLNRHDSPRMRHPPITRCWIVRVSHTAGVYEWVLIFPEHLPTFAIFLYSHLASSISTHTDPTSSLFVSFSLTCSCCCHIAIPANMPYQWSAEKERRMLLLAISSANLRPSADTWQRVAGLLGEGLTASAVRSAALFLEIYLKCTTDFWQPEILQAPQGGRCTSRVSPHNTKEAQSKR